MKNPDLEFPEIQRDLPLQDQSGPRKSRNGLHRLEQTREAFNLGLHVLRAALDDHLVSATARDDMLTALASVCERPENTDGVIVRKHNMFDGLVRHFANKGD